MEADSAHSSELYSCKRKTVRFATTQPLTVAIMKQHQPFGYGVITNISEGGACLMTDAESLSGSFLVRMSFYNAEVVETQARAVWTARCEQIDGGLACHGVEFLGISERDAERLETILHSLPHQDFDFFVEGPRFRDCFASASSRRLTISSMVQT